MRAFGNGLLRAAAVMLACTAGPAHTQQRGSGDYPARPLRIIVTVPAGGSVDSITRAMAQKLSEKVGRAVIVDNRAGGTGTVAMNLTAQAAADGYTDEREQLHGRDGGPKKVPYDIRKAFDPAVQMSFGAYVVTINAALPVNSVKDLIAYARSKPDALSYGTPGIGSIIHLSMELFNYTAGGLRMTHVPYQGNSFAIVDLLAGRINLLLAAAGVAPHIKSGKLKGIAITGGRRARGFPDLPTLAEAGVPGLVLENAYSLYAPAGVRPAILAALNREVSLVMNLPEVREKLAIDGAEPALPHTPAELKAGFFGQFNQWEKFIDTSGIKLE